MKNIAIITARSGSKGLPDKNIMRLNGKSMMAYSIEAAIESKMFEVVMVSTDSERYAKIARSYGAEIPFLRSERTSADTSSSWDTVLEVLDGYEKMGLKFETFCLLQPTSPLRTSNDIVSAYKIYRTRYASVVVSMTELGHPIAWCGKIGDEGSIENFTQRASEERRQEQGKYYRPNGAIYIQKIEDFRRDAFIYRKGAYAYIMPRERSIDVDTEFDFKFAEFLMKQD